MAANGRVESPPLLSLPDIHKARSDAARLRETRGRGGTTERPEREKRREGGERTGLRRANGYTLTPTSGRKQTNKQQRRKLHYQVSASRAFPTSLWETSRLRRSSSGDPRLLLLLHLLLLLIHLLLLLLRRFAAHLLKMSEPGEARARAHAHTMTYRCLGYISVSSCSPLIATGAEKKKRKQSISTNNRTASIFDVWSEFESELISRLLWVLST